MIDTSDGLLRDAGRLATASGVVLDLDPGALRPDPDLVRAAELLGNPAQAPGWVLTGGEDHALLATFAPDGVPPGFVPVGRVLAPGSLSEAEAGEVLVGGRRWAGSTGWVHFG
jgi:thiamine-monophosphate kinase